MSKDLDITEVAVYDEDGRSSLLGTFHGWQHRDGEHGREWWGDVMVYGPDGQYWASVPADRLIKLEVCGRLPSGEIRHRCEGRDLHNPGLKVWI